MRTTWIEASIRIGVGIVALGGLGGGCVEAPGGDVAVATEHGVVAAGARAVMDDYFEAWMGGVDAEALRETLAPDLVAEIPGRPAVLGAEAYLGLVTAGGPVTCPPDRFLERTYAGTRGAFLYECDTPAGPLPFGEWLEVRSGRVGRTRGLFDTTQVFGAAANAAILEANLATVVRPKDPAAFAAIASPGFVAHTGGQDLGLEAFQGFVAGLFAAVPDLDERYHLIEASPTGAVAIALVTGTHTGADLMGVPASGRRIGFTVTHVFRFEGGKLAEQWSEGDFGSALAQITGAAEAPTAADLRAGVERADAEARRDCPPALSDPVTPAHFDAWKRAVPVGDEAAMRELHAPHFRVSFGAGLEGDLDATIGRVAFSKSIGHVASLEGLRLRYVGNRVVAAAGPVAFDYDNPEGLGGLPATSAPTRVAVGEVHALRFCGGKLVRQASNIDGLAFAKAVATPR